MFGTAENPLQAPLLFDVVFFIVVVSLAVEGTTLAPVARWLGLERPRAPEPPVTLEISSLRHVHGEIVDYAIGEGSRAAGRLVKNLALPEGAVIALIARGDHIIPPQGNTLVQAGDHVILVLRPGMQPLMNRLFGRNSDIRGTIPAVMEFPLRGSTCVAELEEAYGVRINAPPKCSLAEVLRNELGDGEASAGGVIRVGPLALRALRYSSDGDIDIVGMSTVPEDDPGEKAAQTEDVAEPDPGST